MFSARKSIRYRIAWSAFCAFGLLYLLVGCVVLIATIRHHTHEYHDMLSRLSSDLKNEYISCNGDIKEMRKHFTMDLEEHGSDNVFLLISSAEGKTLISASVSEKILDIMREHLNPEDFRTYRISCRRKRHPDDNDNIVVRVRKTILPDGSMLSVGYNVTLEERHTIYIATILGASLLFTLFIGGILGFYLAKRITEPLRNISRTARRIASGDYSARVSATDDESEIADLESAFNTMAAENEKTLSDLRTLSDDIAHDLRTPLTRMRAAAEMYRMNNDGSKNLSETIQEETSAMLELINTLLDISQTDNRINRTPRDNIELCSFIRNITDLYSAIVEESGIKKIELSLPKEDVYLSAHKGKLQQLFGNLLDNAVKFTPKNGRISISLSTHPITLIVANTGPGIAPNDIPHVFKRFWRADASRSLPGNGLGLALVKAIVTSYGGTITCQSVPDGWTEFKITF